MHAEHDIVLLILSVCLSIRLSNVFKRMDMSHFFDDLVGASL